MSKEKENTQMEISDSNLPKKQVKRSFNSAKLALKKSGDYSKEAKIDAKPDRGIMNKIS